MMQPLSITGLLRTFISVITGAPSIILLIGFCVWIVASSFSDEAEAPLQNWWKRKHAFHDSLQSPNVRQLTGKLTAPQHTVRMQAIEVLSQLNDPTAVPALIRAIHGFPKDTQYTVAIVNLLGKLGDSRALSALEKLAVRRSLPLQFAARQAIAVIEPHAVLLRASDSPSASIPAASQSLLRPAMPLKAQDDAEMLLRAAACVAGKSE